MRRVRPGPMLLTAIWFGIISGLLESLTSILLRRSPLFTVRVSEEILWVAPVFNIFLMLLIGMGLVLLRGKLGSRKILIATICFTGVAFLGLLLRFYVMPRWSAALLSLGLGVQAARMIRGREDRWLAFQRRSLIPLLGLTCVLALVGATWAHWRERIAVRNLPPVSGNPPNVILITFDTLRADHLSAYGYVRPTTTNMDRLAESGTLFEHAMANSSWTLPAHASLFTGRLPPEHQADWRAPLDDRFPTLAEAFAAHGYRTAAFAANPAYVSPEWGLGRGFALFEVYGDSPASDLMLTSLGPRITRVVLPRLGYFEIVGRKRAADVNREFLDWLLSVQERPFFAFLNYLDVHDPYLTVAPYDRRFSEDVARGDLINSHLQPDKFRRKPTLTPAEIQKVVDGYDGCLAYLDAQLGALVSELEKRGLDKNTLIILTADHGEAFGEHDLFGHGNSLYVESLHVPLIFVWPERIPARKRVERVAGLHQVPSTVEKLLGWKESTFPGPSLMDSWTGETERPATASVLAYLTGNEKGLPSYPSTHGNLYSLMTDQWHFILREDGREELYAWHDDPRETANLAGLAENRAVVESLKAQLMNQLGQESSALRHQNASQPVAPEGSGN